jgi:hypothetical protein
MNGEQETTGGRGVAVGVVVGAGMAVGAGVSVGAGSGVGAGAQEAMKKVNSKQ